MRGASKITRWSAKTRGFVMRRGRLSQFSSFRYRSRVGDNLISLREGIWDIEALVDISRADRWPTYRIRG